MDLTLAALVYIGMAPNQRARSALPDAPEVAHALSGRESGRVARLRERTASIMHRVAAPSNPYPCVD